jgi:hypothetical protein
VPKPGEDPASAVSATVNPEATTTAQESAGLPALEKTPGKGASLAVAAVAGALTSLAILLAAAYVGDFREVMGLNARVSRLEADLAAKPASQDLAALDNINRRLAKLEAAPPPPGAVAGGGANQFSQLEGELKTLREATGVLSRRNDEAVAAAREARERAAAAAAALADLARKVSDNGGGTGDLRNELQELGTRFAALERAEKALQAEVGRDRAGRFGVAAMELIGALDRGTPFTAELAATKRLAADPSLLVPIEPYAASGVPTSAILARELSALTPALVQAAQPPHGNGTVFERLQAHAEQLVRVRPRDGAAAGNSGSVLARLEAKTSTGDLAGMVSEVASLPPLARVPAEPWLAKAKARLAADEIARRLLDQSLAELSK